MTRFTTFLALSSTFLMACGATSQHTWTSVETRAVDIDRLQKADAPIDLDSHTRGSARTTRVALRSGTVLTVPGDARLYRDGDSVLIQPAPDSIMVRTVPVDAITSIEVHDVRTHETIVKPSSSTTAGVLLGVVGVLVVGAVVAHEINASHARTERAILGAGAATGTSGVGFLR